MSSGWISEFLVLMITYIINEGDVIILHDTGFAMVSLCEVEIYHRCLNNVVFHEKIRVRYVISYDSL